MRNASNHLAIEQPMLPVLREGQAMTEEELKEAGLNRSCTRDFKIGSNLSLILMVSSQDGSRTNTFRNGDRPGMMENLSWLEVW